MSTVIKPEANQSRWGFHPCTYETYLKLKKLNYYRHVNGYRLADHKRWIRKAEWNRRGPEPKVCDLPLDALSEEFHEAKTPKMEEQQVRPLRYSIEAIDKFLKFAQLFFDEK